MSLCKSASNLRVIIFFSHAFGRFGLEYGKGHFFSRACLWNASRWCNLEPLAIVRWESAKNAFAGSKVLKNTAPQGPKILKNSPAGSEKCRIPPTGPENPKNQPRTELKSSPNCPAGPENVTRRSVSQSHAAVFGSYIFFSHHLGQEWVIIFFRVLCSEFLGHNFFFACTAPSFWVIIFFSREHAEIRRNLRVIIFFRCEKKL